MRGDEGKNKTSRRGKEGIENGSEKKEEMDIFSESALIGDFSNLLPSLMETSRMCETNELSMIVRTAIALKNIGENPLEVNYDEIRVTEEISISFDLEKPQGSLRDIKSPH